MALSTGPNSGPSSSASTLLTPAEKAKQLQDFVDTFKGQRFTVDRKKQIVDKATEIYGLTPEQQTLLSGLENFSAEDITNVSAIVAGGKDRLDTLKNLSASSPEQFNEMAKLLGVDAAKLTSLVKLSSFDSAQINGLAQIMDVFKVVETDRLKSDDINEVRAEGTELRNEVEELKQMVKDKERMVNPVTRTKYYKNMLTLRRLNRRAKAQNNGIILRKAFGMNRKDMREAKSEDIQRKFESFKKDFGPEETKKISVMHIRLQHEEMFKKVEEIYKFRMAQKLSQEGKLSTSAFGAISNQAQTGTKVIPLGGNGNAKAA